MKRRTACAIVALGLLGGGSLAPLAAALVVDPLVGSQGTDTALPLTDSALTVNGRGEFANLQITVNQTEQLSNQAVSITWSGATPTRTSPGTFSDNYLQIMQCWGDDDGTVPSNPGPPPEQCVFGAMSSITDPPSFVYPNLYATTRIVAIVGQTFQLGEGAPDGNGFYYSPFRAVDGTVVPVQKDPDFIPGVTGGNSWLNPFFNGVTTNEIAGAKSDENGNGSELFEVQTGLQASGLGCGQKTQPSGADTFVVPKCWIVIVPRGDSLDENSGTTLVNAGASAPIATSPLRAHSWQNRIAIPLDFIPVDTPCEIGADERRLAGNDLVQPAIASWQPTLCTTPGLPPYSYVPVGDAAARQQLATSSVGGAGMVVVTRPLDGGQLDTSSPVVYAPLAVSGLTIGFNIERNPRAGNRDEAELLGIRVQRLNLTPRLVAKLLTQSYSTQIRIAGVLPDGYDWVIDNPTSLAADPDFIQFNPEFALLQSSDDRTFSGLQLPLGTSDAAAQVWKWIFADPEAKAWLDGTPDAWGMSVNPVYSTNPSVNPNGIGFDAMDPTNFPKSDPNCFQAPARGLGGSILPSPLCGTDWMPYSRNYTETARAARLGYDGARIVDNPFAQNSSQVWSRVTPQYLTQRMMLSLTDTVSANQFGLQMASLTRAGDNGANRTFIAPDDAGLLAGVSAMTPSAGSSAVLEPSPLASTAGAYPLTTMSYAAIKPLALDAAARDEYATFLEYAVGPGQVRGVELGQLPNGYASLPTALRTQALSAAALIRTMTAPVVTTTTIGGGSGGGSGGGGGGGSTNTDDATNTTDTVVTEPAASTTTTTIAATTTTVAPSVATPSVDGSAGRYAVMGLGLAFIGSALGALEITKRPRRRALDNILIDAPEAE